MRFIYSVLFYLSLPVIGLRLLWRARRNPDYAKRWSERLGIISFSPLPHSVWWHCVSVGETLAALPLIRLFQQKYPTIPLFITTTTPTGSQQVRKNLQDTVQHMYLPYDLPHVMSQFIRRLQPRLLIIMETELWPNLLFYCQQQRIPVILINARLSEKSAKGYARFSSLTHDMLSKLSAIAAQTQEDAQRFVQLGFSQEKLVITGNLKFDMALPPDLQEKAALLKNQWQSLRPVWIAASTHRGEEEIILNAAKALPDTLLILVPRHPDRRKEVLSLCQKHQLNACLRSTGDLPDTQTDVFLIDTVGELLLFYALSHIAFVGGSLIPKGGHNLLEPAALGLPLLSGESLYNFTEIEKYLDNAKALIKVKNAETLAHEIQALFSDKEKCQLLGQAAKSVFLHYKGAAEKQLSLIEQHLTSQTYES